MIVDEGSGFARTGVCCCLPRIITPISRILMTTAKARGRDAAFGVVGNEYRDAPRAGAGLAAPYAGNPLAVAARRTRCSQYYDKESPERARINWASVSAKTR